MVDRDFHQHPRAFETSPRHHIVLSSHRARRSLSLRRERHQEDLYIIPSEHMRRSIYALALLLLLAVPRMLSAQGYYSFSVDSGAYADLAGASLISTVPDTTGYYLTIPFTIEAFGVPFAFDQDSMNVIVFDAGFVAVINSNAQRLCSFDAFVADMQPRGNASSISYTLDGKEGEKVLKIQWKNMVMRGNAASDFADAQLWFFQKDNSFEVHVGPHHVTGQAAYYSYFGPSIGAFLANPDVTTYYDTYHLVGNPREPNPEERNAYYPMNRTPDEGMIYRFIYERPASVERVVASSGAVIYPNPSSDVAWLRLPEALHGAHPTLLVSDMLGREVMRVDGVADGDRIATSALSNGLYLVTLREGGHVYSGGSLVVRR
jgi:hypothetical protein